MALDYSEKWSLLLEHLGILVLEEDEYKAYRRALEVHLESPPFTSCSQKCVEIQGDCACADAKWGYRQEFVVA